MTNTCRARLGALVAATLMGSAAMGASSVASAAAAPLAPHSQVRQAEDGTIGIRLLEAPVDRKDDPRALSYIVDHLRPGSSITRKLEVSNTTDQRQRVQLYSGPADIKDGQFIGEESGSESELTTWTSLSMSTLGLAPGESAEVEATIDVASDASEGERYGVIWASVRSRGPGQVKMVNRVGIRIYLSVGRGGEPASDFRILSLAPSRTAKGAGVVVVEVKNTGGRALDITGNLRLKDGPGGLKAGPFEVRTDGTLAPGDEQAIGIKLDENVPKGPWLAVAKMRSGLIERRAKATITFPDAGLGAAVKAEPDDPWWKSWPLGAIVAGALVLLLGLLALLLLLRRRRARDARARNEGLTESA